MVSGSVARLHRKEVAAGTLGKRIGIDQLPEPSRMVRLDQMGKLVNDHIVEDPGWECGQTIRDPNACVRRCARTPAQSLAGRELDLGRRREVV